MEKPQVEVLAPASGLEAIQAAVYAGADAVYTGGSKFGARAYADNLEEEELLRAIDFVHLHDKRLYLTVNTLLKEQELMEQLIAYLKPFYRQGLDAVIVQDIGVFRVVKKYFPDLAVHISTQAVVTGENSAKLYEELGAQRIVTARELSLAEIRRIHETADIEIESFVHGALCYCYSGQCLFSSLAGGRSGNRGRCAQPCRLPYEFLDGQKKRLNRKKESYLLSPKDMCALDILPDIIEAGVYSLKIEGRMKRVEYTAGVTQIYRKYVDRYLQYGKERYEVEPEDRRRLMDLYNRGSFHDGYYKKHNGREMMSLERPNHNGVYVGKAVRKKTGYVLENEIDLHRQDVLELRGIFGKEKRDAEWTIDQDIPAGSGCMLPPKYAKLFEKGKQAPASRHTVKTSGGHFSVYRTRNERLLQELHKAFAKKKLQLPVRGTAVICPGQPAALSLKMAATEENVCIRGAVVQEAVNQPIDETYVRKQLKKTGNTPFYFQKLEIQLQGSCFLSAKELNQLRREALDALEQKLLFPYRRAEEGEEPEEHSGLADGSILQKYADQREKKVPFDEKPACRVYVETEEQLEAVCEYPFVETVYVSLHACGILKRQGQAEGLKNLQRMKQMCQKKNKQMFASFPYIWRRSIQEQLQDSVEAVLAYADGILVRNIETLAFLRKYPIEKQLVLDASVYAMNTQAVLAYQELGADRITCPTELNRKELQSLLETMSLPGELILYGHMPMMISAQCLVKNTIGCEQQPGCYYLKDRKGKLHLVKNFCDTCYTVIYNSDPMYLLDVPDERNKLSDLAAFRMDFTVERAQEVRQILDAFEEERAVLEQITRGHWNRGVE